MKRGKEGSKRRKMELIERNPITCDENQKQKDKTQSIMRAMQHNMDKHQFYIISPLGRFWGGFNYMSAENSIKNKRRK